MQTEISHHRPVAFLLPGLGIDRPMGGYKMVYVYANLLVKKGYDVTIVYSACSGLRRAPWRTRLAPFLRYPAQKISGNYRHVGWFTLDERVKRKFVWSFDTVRLRQDVLYVSTSIQTAFALAKRNVPVANKAYFIQGYENWYYTDEEVMASYRLGLRMVAISRWLCSKVQEAGASATFIPNGFHSDVFYVTKTQSQRPAHSVSMLYHKDRLKGSDDGLCALMRLKGRYKDLEAHLFGVPERPANLPSWIQYSQKASPGQLRDIYNSSAVFLGTSLVEGWGLCVGEAMMCGCAVACTDIGGYREMATDAETALLCPPGNVDEMVKNVSLLMEDDMLRFNLSGNAVKRMVAFGLDRSLEKWTKIIDEKQ